MKKLILVAALSLFGFMAQAQTVRKDAAGNYHQVKTDSTRTAKSTGKTFTDLKGTSYPVMLSKTGKLFYTRTSKAGNKYNVYIKN